MKDFTTSFKSIFFLFLEVNKIIGKNKLRYVNYQLICSIIGKSYKDINISLL